jgi:hypothetical protein
MNPKSGTIGVWTRAQSALAYQNASGPLASERGVDPQRAHYLEDYIVSSRNEICPRHHGVTIVVGWDNPLMTFFAQVLRVQNDDDGRDTVLLWLGTQYGEIARPEELVGPVSPYADLADTQLDQLRTDRAADADRAPSALQRAMLDRRRR